MNPKDLCPHDLFKDWCGICRHIPTQNFENERQESDKELVNKVLSWAR